MSITVAEKNEIFLICAGTDITEERRAQERLRILANTDTVTGLPNRNAIHEFINHAIASAGESQVGIVYLDLDNFKKINDAYGHMFGDQLLQAVSLALLSCLEEDQLLARLGGDEFIVLAAHTSQAALEAVASRILTPSAATVFVLDSLKFTRDAPLAFRWPPGTDRTATVSFALPTPQCITPKKAAAVSSAFFSPEMNQRVFDYHWLDTNLRKALENDQLLIHYQPKLPGAAKYVAGSAGTLAIAGTRINSAAGVHLIRRRVRTHRPAGPLGDSGCGSPDCEMAR